MLCTQLEGLEVTTLKFRMYVHCTIQYSGHHVVTKWSPSGHHVVTKWSSSVKIGLEFWKQNMKFAAKAFRPEYTTAFKPRHTDLHTSAKTSLGPHVHRAPRAQGSSGLRLHRP